MTGKYLAVKSLEISLKIFDYLIKNEFNDCS